jgi:hypothetical protein
MLRELAEGKIGASGVFLYHPKGWLFRLVAAASGK